LSKTRIELKDYHDYTYRFYSRTYHSHACSRWRW